MSFPTSPVHVLYHRLRQHDPAALQQAHALRSRVEGGWGSPHERAALVELRALHAAHSVVEQRSAYSRSRYDAMGAEAYPGMLAFGQDAYPGMLAFGQEQEARDLSDAELGSLLVLIARAETGQRPIALHRPLRGGGGFANPLTSISGVPMVGCYPQVGACYPQFGRGGGGSPGGGGGGGGGARGFASGGGAFVSSAGGARGFASGGGAFVHAPAAPAAGAHGFASGGGAFVPAHAPAAPPAHAPPGHHPLPPHPHPVPFHHAGHGGAGWALWQGYPFWAYNCWWVLTVNGWQCYQTYPTWWL